MKSLLFRYFQNKQLVLLVGSALFIRLFIACFIQTPLLSDDGEYHAIGISLSQGNGFLIDGQPSAFRPPGYPVFLGFWYWLVGISPLLIRFVQAFIDTASCLLVFLIADQIWNRRTALLAASVLAVFPLHVLFVARISSETIYTFLLLLVVWCTVRVWKDNQWFHQLAAVSILLGLAILVRPTAGIFIPAILWYLWKKENRPYINLSRLAIFIVTIFFVLTPWMVRNYSTFGRLTLTSNTGLNLWIGNNPQATGGYYFPSTNNPLLDTLDRFKQSDKGTRLALEYMSQHPLTYPLLIMKKLVFFCTSDFELMRFIQYKPAWADYRNASSIYREFSLPLWVFLDLSFFLVMVVGIVGMTQMPEQSTRSVQLIFSFILLSIGIHLIFYGSARYRMPMMPFVIFFTASGWISVISGTYIVRVWKKWLIALVLIFLLAVETAEIIMLNGKVQKIDPVIRQKQFPQ